MTGQGLMIRLCIKETGVLITDRGNTEMNLAAEGSMAGNEQSYCELLIYYCHYRT